MSDVEQKTELSNEEKLAMTLQRIWITAAFFCIGWLVLFMSIPLVNTLGGGAGVLAFVGWALMSAPIIRRMLKSKGLKGAMALTWMDMRGTYTDSYGSKRVAKHDADSLGTSALISVSLFVFKIFLLILVGSIVTFVYLIYLVIKYFVLHISVKPRFMEGIFPVVIATIAGFLTPIFLIGAIEGFSTGRILPSAAISGGIYIGGLINILIGVPMLGFTVLCFLKTKK
ncbi:MAG: hypothetical protein LBU88_03270 [Treponema sp.]|jgi:hypothetical protein|nr:hypothetical protein [Treponema sp.]